MNDADAANLGWLQANDTLDMALSREGVPFQAATGTSETYAPWGSGPGVARFDPLMQKISPPQPPALEQWETVGRNLQVEPVEAAMEGLAGQYPRAAVWGKDPHDQDMSIGGIARRMDQGLTREMPPMITEASQAIKNILGGSRRPEDLVDMMKPVVAANLLRLSLTSKAVPGQRPPGVQEVIDGIRADARFEQEANRIYGELKRYKDEQMLPKMYERNVRPHEQALLDRLRATRSDAEISALAEETAAHNVYATAAAEGETSVGAFGARDSHLTFGKTLKSHADIKTNFPEADFWIIRKGQNAGKVTTEFSPSAIGVRSRNHNIDPTFMRYWMMEHERRGYFKQAQRGAVMPHIRVEDVEAIPVQFRDGPTTIEFGAFGSRPGRMSKGQQAMVEMLIKHKGDVQAAAAEMGIDPRRMRDLALNATADVKSAKRYQRRKAGSALAELPKPTNMPDFPGGDRGNYSQRKYASTESSRLDTLFSRSETDSRAKLTLWGEPNVDRAIMEAHRRGESSGMIANMLRRTWGNDPSITVERVNERIAAIRNQGLLRSAPIAPLGPKPPDPAQDERLRGIQHNQELLRQGHPWTEVPAPAPGNEVAPGYDPRVNEVLALPGFET